MSVKPGSLPCVGRWLQHACLALASVVVALSIAACSQSATQSPAGNNSSGGTTPTPTLAPLAAQPGWTVTAHLGYVSEGVVTSGTSFVASKPYQVVVTCRGNGNLAITVAAPDPSTQLVMCTATPQTQTVAELFPKVGQTVQINVSAPDGVTWTGIVEVKQ